MSIDFDSDAKLNTISARYVVNNTADKREAKHLVDSMAFQRIRDMLASELVQSGMQVTEDIYSTRYEMRLYVLTPDQLEKYVTRRAQRLGYLPGAIVEEHSAEAPRP